MNLVGQVIKSCKVRRAFKKHLSLNNQVHIPVNLLTLLFITYMCISFKSVALGLKQFEWTNWELKCHPLKNCVSCASFWLINHIYMKILWKQLVPLNCSYNYLLISFFYLPQPFSGARPRKIKNVKLTSRAKVAIMLGNFNGINFFHKICV